MWDERRTWIAEPVTRSPQTTRQSARNDAGMSDYLAGGMISPLRGCPGGFVGMTDPGHLRTVEGDRPYEDDGYEWRTLFAATNVIVKPCKLSARGRDDPAPTWAL